MSAVATETQTLLERIDQLEARLAGLAADLTRMEHERLQEPDTRRLLERIEDLERGARA